MEALRIIQKPVNQKITIELPKSFGDEEVEIIVLPVVKENGRHKKIDPTQYRGAIKLDMSEEEIAKECQKLRAEWERDF